MTLSSFPAAETISAGRTAIVTGATGQDGYFLTQRLLADGWTVYALTNRLEGLSELSEVAGKGAWLRPMLCDLADPSVLLTLVRALEPDELYNLGGQSSVADSFADPLHTWRVNANFVARLLECIRCDSPGTRVYQASSTDMFGYVPGGEIVHDEESRLNPLSPYASSKAAAHMLCDSYRSAYNLRIACGILSNHESHRRPPPFLTRKVVDYVAGLGTISASELGDVRPLRMGNLMVRRDWGYAPNYVDGMIRILRQVQYRANKAGDPPEPDQGACYKDYVLGTGQSHAVWQLVDRAFALTGWDLEWFLGGTDAAQWHARFRETGSLAVVVDPNLIRASDPLAISVRPSRAERELGWEPVVGLDTFLSDMLRLKDTKDLFPEQSCAPATVDDPR